jgi:hypothetical protein
VILNAANKDTVLPTIRAAIHAGAHYCDVAAWGDIIESALLHKPVFEVENTHDGLGFLVEELGRLGTVRLAVV